MTGDRDSLSERMADAARRLQDQDDPVSTMRTSVELAVANVRGCDAAAISLVRKQKRIETPVHSDERAARSDELQYELGEGPCLDAIWEQRVVHSPDLSTDERWRQWAPRAAAEYGVRSMLCFQLFTHGDTVGGLNLYAWTPHAFDESDQEDGAALAAHIAIAVTDAQKIEQLSTALDSRTLIGQAVGMIMERYSLPADQAFKVLGRLSSESNTKLRDLAQQVVDTRRLPQSGPSSSRQKGAVGAG